MGEPTEIGVVVRKFLISTLLLSVVGAKAFGAAAPAAAACSANLPAPPGAVTVGLGLQVVLPNFQNFDGSLAMYGPLLSVPVGSHSVHLLANFGASDSSMAYLVESAFLFNLQTPYLPWFLLGGVHFLHYRALQVNHDIFGVHVGPGLKFAMGNSMELELAMKIYFQQVIMTSFSGGLGLRL